MSSGALHAVYGYHEGSAAKKLKKARLVVARTGDVEPLPVLGAEPAFERIPSPVAEIADRSHDVARQWLDLPTVRRCDQTRAKAFEIAVTHQEVDSAPQSASEDVLVTRRATIYRLLSLSKGHKT
jgi:hypothetical protein